MSDLKFSIEGEAQSAARFSASARQFNIVIDEPPQLGGEDLGANPVEYLLASYAGCINVVAHLTARELGIELEKLEIAVQGNINPARLFGQSDEERAGFKQIDVQFSPVTNAAPELVEEWIKVIKNRCPINDNLAFATPLTFNLTRKEVPSVN
jgi:uncharacterized OsmC-like protein